MIKTYKRKLILTKEQECRLTSWIGACRVVFNLGLEINIAAYKTNGKYITHYDLQKQITDLRKEYEWINDVPYATLEAVTERLDKAYKSFFKGGGFPKWASKKTYKSIHFKKNLSIIGGKVKIPRIGIIKMFKDAPMIGKPKTAQIIIEPTGFFISIQCELPDQKLCGENQAAIGIDMGIAQFCTLSDGSMIENPKHFAGHERKLRIENRSLARKKKGSNSWKKQAKKLARLHHTIGNVRRDFLHKTSTDIARKYSTVYVEDLKIKNMSKNKNLSKHILDCGWGMFRTMLEYKTNVVKVNPRHTSQTCNSCGSVDAKSRISQSEFKCTNCGHEKHADINAALNIMSRGAAQVR
jgi:putative transposase